MLCPFCKTIETQVKDSRFDANSNTIKRRRCCPQCNMRFNTEERITPRDLKVEKNSGKREVFDRGKLEYSIRKALAKGAEEPGVVDGLVSQVINELTVRKDAVISSKDLAEITLLELKKYDKISYLRFVMVHKRISDLANLKAIIQTLEAESKPED